MYLLIGRHGHGWEICGISQSHTEASKLYHEKKDLFHGIAIVDCPAVCPLTEDELQKELKADDE
jgi:hypothetical protein